MINLICWFAGHKWVLRTLMEMRRDEHWPNIASHRCSRCGKLG